MFITSSACSSLVTKISSTLVIVKSFVAQLKNKPFVHHRSSFFVLSAQTLVLIVLDMYSSRRLLNAAAAATRPKPPPPPGPPRGAAASSSFAPSGSQQAPRRNEDDGFWKSKRSKTDELNFKYFLLKKGITEKELALQQQRQEMYNFWVAVVFFATPVVVIGLAFLNHCNSYYWFFAQQ